LSERSATCPLCKTEFYDPEEEESKDDDKEEQAATPTPQLLSGVSVTITNKNNNSFPSRFFYAFNPRTAGLADEEAPAEQQQQQETERLISIPDDSSPTPGC
jgi:hypothetical protein